MIKYVHKCTSNNNSFLIAAWHIPGSNPYIGNAVKLHIVCYLVPSYNAKQLCKFSIPLPLFTARLSSCWFENGKAKQAKKNSCAEGYEIASRLQDGGCFVL